MRTKDGIAGAPRSPSGLPSNGRKKFSRHLVGVDPRYGVASPRIIVSNHVCVPVTMVPDKISNPIWMAGLVDRLAGEGDTQWARASRDRRLRTVTHVTIGISTADVVNVGRHHRDILITHNTMNFLIRKYPLHDGVSRDVLDIFALGVEEEMVGELN